MNLRRRVRSYFTGSETRGRIKEMVALATRVDHVECAHGLEAGVRELRLLVAHAPPYNRRSKFPKRGWWITLTEEPFPRFAIVRNPTVDALGPFGARADAADVAATIAEFSGLRTCTTRLSRTAIHDCPPAVVGGCPAAADGMTRNSKEYAPAPDAVRALFAGTDDAALRAMLERIRTCSRAEHFEAAARLRDRTVTVIRALYRTQRLAAVARIAELVAAHPDGAGGWEFAVIRHGRLAARARQSGEWHRCRWWSGSWRRRKPWSATAICRRCAVARPRRWAWWRAGWPGRGADRAHQRGLPGTDARRGAQAGLGGGGRGGGGGVRRRHLRAHVGLSAPRTCGGRWDTPSPCRGQRRVGRSGTA